MGYMHAIRTARGRRTTVAAASLALVASALGVAPAGADTVAPIGSPTFRSTGTEWVTAGSYVYFAANDDVHGNELWRTDGTAAGTQMVADLNTGGSTDSGNPTDLTAIGSRLYFRSYSDPDYAGDPSYGWFAVEGTGAPQEISYPYGSAAEPTRQVSGHLVGVWGDKLMTLGYTVQQRYVLYSVSPGALSTTTVNTGGARPGPHMPKGVQLGADFYWAGTGFDSGGTLTDGMEVWRQTPGGGAQVANIRPGVTGSNPDDFIATSDAVYFTADNGQNGRELWRTDGTTAGTRLVKDHSGNSSATTLYPGRAVRGNTLYYVPNDYQTGPEVWSTDGTTTQVVKDVAPGGAGNAGIKIVVVGQKVFFTHGNDLFAGDGTSAGMSNIASFEADGYGPDLFAPVGDRLYLRGGGLGGSSLWRSDGTAAGTFVLSQGGFDFSAFGNASAGPFARLGSQLIFSARFPVPAGSPYSSDWRRIYSVDLNAPDLVRTARVAPTLGGTGQVKTGLTLNPGEWTHGPVRTTYQWFVDGQPAAGKTAPSLYAAPEYLGKRVHATVTVRGVGAPDVTVATAPLVVTETGVQPTPGKLSVTKKAAIRGKAKVGKKLRVVNPQVSMAGARFSYQWTLNGKKIKKATRSSLKVLARHRGKKIRVVVTAKVGGQQVVSKSKAVKVPRKR